MKKLLFIFLVLTLAACVKEETVTNDKGQAEVGTSDVVEGELLVKFSEEVSDIIEDAGLVKGPATRSGVVSVDNVLSIVGDYTFERVFPYNERTEAKTKERGLHLWYVVRFDSSRSTESVARELSQIGEVSRVEFNKVLRRANTKKAIPYYPSFLTKSNVAGYFNDPYSKMQWHLFNNGSLNSHEDLNQPEPTNKFITGADVNVLEAWTKCTGDDSIIVAVLDEGVDITHPDLKDNIWVNPLEEYYSHKDADGNGYAGDRHGYNFIKNTGVISFDDVYDTGHGTHVSGVIAAVNNNGIGISSIAGGTDKLPGVKIMSCQIFSGNYAGSVLAEVRAIKYAADNGAVVLQCSWGYVSGAANPFDWTPQYSDDDEWLSNNPLEVDALQYFIHTAGSPNGTIDGGVAIFAGGNEAAAAAGYPGAYGDFVSVAAIAGDYTPATYSNYGPGTTISAPGGDQDYYFEYGAGSQMGYLGCVLSTLPTHVSPSGYGYMEGTSMACPHVSGVVALGMSYAAQLRKHFTADEFKKMLYDSATDFEDYLTGTKKYYRYVTDLQQNTAMTMNLDSYKKQMGHGLVNAAGLLALVADDKNGIKLSFPNVYVAPNADVLCDARSYFDNGASLTYTVTIDNSSIATATVEGTKIKIKGLAIGQTAAKITASNGVTSDFVITVRTNANGNGWL